MEDARKIGCKCIGLYMLFDISGTGNDDKDCTGQEPKFSPGQRISGFDDMVYVRPLSQQGGFSEVHLVYERLERRYYAMKVPRAQLLKDEKNWGEFFFEAERLCSLPFHPNLVKVVNFTGSDYGWPLLFTEYIEGVTISEFHHNSIHNPFPATSVYTQVAPCEKMERQALALYLMKGAVRGLAHAYSNSGIIHLDIKPQNVLVESHTGIPKVIDFGLGRNLLQSSSQTFHSFSQIAGTLPYMSPEHFRGLKYCDARSDVYSVGIMLFYLLSGALPFYIPPESPQWIQRRQLYEAFHEKGTVKEVPGCERSCTDLILRCIEKDPGKRYQSVEELLWALERVSGESDSERGEKNFHHEPDVADYQSRAVVNLEINAPQESARLCTRAMTKAPQHLPTRLTQANVMRVLGRHDEAIRIVRSILAQYPENELAFSTHAALLHDLRQPEKIWPGAEWWINNAAEANTLVNIICCCHALGDFMAAQKVMKSGLLRFPDAIGFIACHVNHLLLRQEDEAAEAYLRNTLNTRHDFTLYLLLANHLLGLGKVEEAEQLLEHYIADFGPQQRIGMLYAACAEAVSNWDGALERIQKAFLCQPGTADCAAALVRIFYRNNKHTEAMDFGRSWCDKYYASPAVLLALAEVYQSLNRIGEALKCTRQAKETFFHDPSAAVAHIRLLTQCNRHFQALKQGIFWHDSCTPSAPAWAALSEAYHLVKKAQKRDLFHAYINVHSKKHRIARQGIILHLLDGDAQQALSLSGALSGDDRPTAQWWRQLARGKAACGEWDQAILLLQHACTLTNIRLPLERDLFSFLHICGKHRAAARIGKDVLDRDPHDHAIAAQLADIFFHQGELNHAQRLIDHALVHYPQSAKYAAYRLGLLLRQQKSAEAKAWGDEWMAQYTPTARFLNALGQVSGNLGKVNEAAALFARAVDMDPKEAYYKANLQRIKDYANAQANGKKPE